MNAVIVASDRVRVPEPKPGTATAVHRYDTERAFVLHPDDFHRLTALESFVAAAVALPPLELSDAALAAHRDESAPGESVTDPDALKALLGA